MGDRSDETQHGGGGEHGHGEYLDDEGLLGEGRQPRVLEPEQPDGHRQEEARQGAEGEADSDQRRPDPADGHDADADDEPGDGLQQEERSDGGDGAVAVRLAPEVKVDGGRPDQERPSEGEGSGGRQRERPAEPAGTEGEEGPELAHARHPETLLLPDVGADGGHGRDTDRRRSGIGPDRGIPGGGCPVDLGMRESRVAEGEFSDEALLAGMAVGDQSAAVTFTRRYQRRLFGLAYSMTNDAGVAEDVAQEAMIRVWRHAPVFDPRRGSVTSWVLTITRNLAIDALRLRRAVPTDPDDFAAAAMVSLEHNPEDAVRRGDARETVTAALRVLPEEQRRAVVLAAVYGRTALEISESEGIPLGTAKTRIRTALMRLRAAVEPAEGRRDE